MKRKMGLSLAVICLFGLLAGYSISHISQAQEPTTPAFAKGGAEDCMDCHDEPPITLILNTPHAQVADKRTPFASEQCESCHGASPEHMRKVEGQEIPPPPKVIFGTKSPTPVAEQNETCIGCHEGGVRTNWTASPHHAADLACASCHTVHANKDPILLAKTQAETCYGCHVEQRAQSFRRSRHPIREGKIACTDCHNPHGSVGPKLLKEASVNDTCFGCHTEKRGPFLWEHAPVRDNCTNCHTPHGSSQARLLKVRTPFLCQQCHQEAFHPSTLYSGTGVPPLGAGERVLAKGCLNCHPKVHGTNHPSGSRFTR